jgi:hypothetical protein
MLVGIPVVPATEADRRLIAVCGVLTASYALGENLNLSRTTFPGARLQLGFFVSGSIP